MELKDESHTHIAYSDEAYYNGGEYSSICLVSLKLKDNADIEKRLLAILKESGLEELKWSRMGSARERLCAIKLIDFVYLCIKNKLMRIDTVIWNSRDRKERIPEDNNKILSKMYYHLFRNVLTMRWPKGCKWVLFPDEQSIINWEEMKKILENISSKVFLKKNEDGSIVCEINKDFDLFGIKEVNSKNSPICQIADFFSGLAAYYHLEFPLLNLNPEQKTLDNQVITLSNREIERIEVIRYLKNKFSGSSIEISFDFNRGMHTKNPNGQINFWQFKLNPKKHESERLHKWF